MSLIYLDSIKRILRCAEFKIIFHELRKKDYGQNKRIKPPPGIGRDGKDLLDYTLIDLIQYLYLIPNRNICRKL